MKSKFKEKKKINKILNHNYHEWDVCTILPITQILKLWNHSKYCHSSFLFHIGFYVEFAFYCRQC